MDVPISDRGIFLFGPFQLDTARRALLRDGVRVNLTARMFDTLLCLVEHADRVVETDELMAAAGRGRAVETISLVEIIFALRRVLKADETGETLIVTAAGGYRFAAPVQFELAPAEELRSGLFDRKVAPVAGLVGAAPPRPPWWRSWQAMCGAVVMVVAVAGIGYWRTLPTRPPFVPPAHSVAVLAFTTMSGDPGEASFAAAVSEALAGALSRVHGLSVAGRSASFAFDSGDATVSDVARRLNVGAVLEGSVRRYGTRVRIIARLSNGVTGDRTWSHSYDQDLRDTAKIEATITEEVTASASKP
jgi:TolB-like protein/DNA-binding winged helix-turn-helix (wHTH) protein